MLSGVIKSCSSEIGRKRQTMDVDDDNFDVDEEIESEIERRIKQSQENIEKLTRASLSTLPRVAETAPCTEGTSARLSVDATASPHHEDIDLTQQPSVTPRRDSRSDDFSSMPLIPGVKAHDREAFEPLSTFLAAVARDRLHKSDEVRVGPSWILQ